MRIIKYTPKQKIKACKDYLSGRKSTREIARELDMGKNGCTMVWRWAGLYKANGPSIFYAKSNNTIYTKEFKEKVVKEYLTGKGSQNAIANKYHLSNERVIQDWIKKYNNHIELKDYNPHSEVYMADTLKVNKEKKIEIVKWCLENNRDIKLTASHFKGNYAQIYQWVKKYELHGEDGLDDRRGKRKAEKELTELEKAYRKIEQVEKEKEEFRKKYELLKKAEQIERW